MRRKRRVRGVHFLGAFDVAVSLRAVIGLSENYPGREVPLGLGKLLRWL
jgi:hypothetical protein